MQLWKRALLDLVAVAGAAGLMVSAPSASAEINGSVTIETQPAPPPAQRVTYHYVYYPQAEVYFVPEQRVYWVMDGGTWRSMSTPPPTINLGASVNLDIDKPEPWTEHQVIVKKYGGKHEKIKIKEKREKDNKD